MAKREMRLLSFVDMAFLYDWLALSTADPANDGTLSFRGGEG